MPKRKQEQVQNNLNSKFIFQNFFYIDVRPLHNLIICMNEFNLSHISDGTRQKRKRKAKRREGLVVTRACMTVRKRSTSQRELAISGRREMSGDAMVKLGRQRFLLSSATDHTQLILIVSSNNSQPSILILVVSTNNFQLDLITVSHPYHLFVKTIKYKFSKS